MTRRGLVHLVDGDGRDPVAQDRIRNSSEQLGHACHCVQVGWNRHAAGQRSAPRKRDVGVDVPLGPMFDRILDQVGQGVCLSGSWRATKTVALPVWKQRSPG